MNIAIGKMNPKIKATRKTVKEFRNDVSIEKAKIE
jgi:non-canonical (house-cleaning) NTP pyrophosphatase